MPARRSIPDDHAGDHLAGCANMGARTPSPIRTKPTQADRPAAASHRFHRQQTIEKPNGCPQVRPAGLRQCPRESACGYEQWLAWIDAYRATCPFTALARARHVTQPNGSAGIRVRTRALSASRCSSEIAPNEERMPSVIVLVAQYSSNEGNVRFTTISRVSTP
jgi:hypothetical protein